MTWGTDQLGLMAMIALTLAGIGLVQKSRLSTELKAILSIGLLLRLAGAAARLFVIYNLYDGVGDAVGYYSRSLEYSQELRGLGFGWLFDDTQWYSNRWWGTNFVHIPTTVILAVLGPSIYGGFTAFALLGFIGLVGLLVAFQRSFPELGAERYAAWLLLFPSLWFWPSSIGKEALVICGLGLAVFGFVGRGGSRNWLVLPLGLALVFAIRPQFAAVIGLAMAGTEWLRRETLWSAGNLLRAIPLLALGGWIVLRAGVEMGLDSYSLESLDTFITESPSRRAEGGTSVGVVPVGILGVPIALVNILFRPLPWEATNPMVLLSAVEIWGLWVVAWIRRKSLMATLRRWRSNRLVGFSVLFVLGYSVALGLMVVNVGIIARQRIFLFPFLFVLLWGCGEEAEEQERGAEATKRTQAAPSSRRAPEWESSTAPSG